MYLVAEIYFFLHSWSTKSAHKNVSMGDSVALLVPRIIILSMTSLRRFKALILMLFLEMAWVSAVLALNEIGVMLLSLSCQAKLFPWCESTCLPMCNLRLQCLVVISFVKRLPKNTTYPEHDHSSLVCTQKGKRVKKCKCHVLYMS